MATDFGLIAHAAERHANEFTAGCLGNGFAERGFANAGRPNEAEDRPFHLVGAALHGKIFDNPFLHLVETEVIGIENALREGQITLDLALYAPWQAQQPIEIVAHDGGFRRHRAHLPKLLDFGFSALAGFLRELGVLDLLLEIANFVALLAVAQFLLNGLHLLIQIVFALGLLHLALDAAADALFNLEHGNLAFHHGKGFLKPGLDGLHFKDFLLLGDLDGEMGSNGIGQLAEIGDLAKGGEDFLRHLLVQLHIAFELGNGGAGERLGFLLVGDDVGQQLHFGLEIVGMAGEAHDLGTLGAFDKHLHGAVGQFQQLQDLGKRAHFIDGIN